MFKCAELYPLTKYGISSPNKELDLICRDWKRALLLSPTKYGISFPNKELLLIDGDWNKRSDEILGTSVTYQIWNFFIK